MNDLTEFLRQPFWGATPGDYIAFVLIIAAALLLKRPLSVLIARASSGLAMRFSGDKHRTLFRSLVRKPLEWLIAVILFFFAFSFIEAPLDSLALLHRNSKDGAAVLRVSDVIEHLAAFAAIIFTTLLLSRILDFIYQTQADEAAQRMERERAQLLPLLKDVLKIVLWTMGFFWLLGVVFHVNIPALITGLGIGGVALALAAKESIENLLASFTILADKPFVVDDTVKLGAMEGKVIRIGFRSTRLRSADGSLFIVPNKKLIDDNLENLSERDVRKMRLIIPLKNTTSPAVLQSLMDAIRGLIEAETHVQGAAMVSVESFTETAVQLLVSYHLPDDLAEEHIQTTKTAINQKVYNQIADLVTAPQPS